MEFIHTKQFFGLLGTFEMLKRYLRIIAFVKLQLKL